MYINLLTNSIDACDRARYMPVTAATMVANMSCDVRRMMLKMRPRAIFKNPAGFCWILLLYFLDVFAKLLHMTKARDMIPQAAWVWLGTSTFNYTNTRRCRDIPKLETLGRD